MLRTTLAALLLATLLAMPVLAQSTDDRMERRQEAMERWQSVNETARERGLAWAESHGLFARFLYDGSNGTAYGRFLRLTLQPSSGTLQDVRVRATAPARPMGLVRLTPLFESVVPAHFALQSGPIVLGANLGLDGTDLDFVAHNDAHAAMGWHAAAATTLTFTLAPGLTATRTDGHEARITVGGTHAHIVSNAATNLTVSADGHTVTVPLAAGDGAIVRVHTLGDSSAGGLHDFIAAFKVHRLGAFLRVADADGAAFEDGESNDVHASTRSIARGHIVWDVDSAQHAGRVLFLTLDNSTLDLARLDRVEARLNTTLLEHKATIAEVVAYTGTNGAYAIVPSADGLTVTVAVAVPHFSSYALALTQLSGSGTTTTGAGGAGGATGSGGGAATGAGTSGSGAGSSSGRAPGLEVGLLLLATLGVAFAARRRAA